MKNDIWDGAYLEALSRHPEIAAERVKQAGQEELAGAILDFALAFDIALQRAFGMTVEEFLGVYRGDNMTNQTDQEPDGE
jgi:hypothetical protein